MNSKIVCGVIFVLFCIFQLGYAIKCYRCSDESACKNATVECNHFYANETSTFLDTYYLSVNTSSTSSSYFCMRKDLKFSSSNTVNYKGCVYAHINSCSLTLKPIYANSNSSCTQCNYRDGCNPADRKSISTAAMVIPMVLGLIYKHFAL